MSPSYDILTTISQKALAQQYRILQCKYNNVKVACIQYYYVLKLIRNLDDFRHFVDGISTPSNVGGDGAEDVFGGLDAVHKLNWPKYGTKVTVLYTNNEPSAHARARFTVVGSVCVCVSLSGENKLLRSLTPAICSSYSIYNINMTNARFITCGF